MNSKNFQNFWGGRMNKKEQLSFWAKIQNPNGVWIKNSGSNQYLKLVWIFKSTKPFGKNPNNSPKLSLGMTFKNINLDGNTCVQKIWISFRSGKLAFKEELRRFEFGNNVCTVASPVTTGCHIKK
jgi:hypothetical protein